VNSSLIYFNSLSLTTSHLLC